MKEAQHTKHLAILAVIIAFNVALSYIVKIHVTATYGLVNLV